MSDSEDTESILEENKKSWMKRQQRRKRDLEDTVRFPRYRTGVPDVQISTGQRVDEPKGEIGDGVEDIERGTAENPIYLDESDVDPDVDSSSDSEMEDVMDEDEVEVGVEVPRHRGTSVSLESVLKHLEMNLRWKMEFGIWQRP